MDMAGMEGSWLLKRYLKKKEKKRSVNGSVMMMIGRSLYKEMRLELPCYIKKGKRNVLTGLHW